MDVTPLPHATTLTIPGESECGGKGGQDPCPVLHCASEALASDAASQADKNTPKRNPSDVVHQLIVDASQPKPSWVKHTPWQVAEVLAVHARARGSVWYCVVEYFGDRSGPARVLLLSQKKRLCAFVNQGTSDTIETRTLVRYGVLAISFCRELDYGL